MRSLDILINPWRTLSVRHRRLWWHWLPPAHGLTLSLLIDAEDALKRNEANPKQNGKECDPLHCRFLITAQSSNAGSTKYLKRVKDFIRRRNVITPPSFLFQSFRKRRKRRDCKYSQPYSPALIFLLRPSQRQIVFVADGTLRMYRSCGILILLRRLRAVLVFRFPADVGPSHRCRHPATCGSRPPWSGTHGG